MKIEEMVLSIEQMQHLNELGLKVKDTALSWCEVYKDVFGKNIENPPCTLLREPSVVAILPGWKIVPTLTLQEILELLPDHIVVDNSYYELIINKNECWIAYLNFDSKEPFKIYHFMGNKLKALYKMLCWVLENGYLKDN